MKIINRLPYSREKTWSMVNFCSTPNLKSMREILNLKSSMARVSVWVQASMSILYCSVRPMVETSVQQEIPVHEDNILQLVLLGRVGRYGVMFSVQPESTVLKKNILK